jgi:REP element-mobilizing transposase RayT
MYSDPLAYLITWTCYGTWLPGDARGWTKWHHSEKQPQPLLAEWSRTQMGEPAVVLDKTHREVVETTVAKHCELRQWQLHAVSCRTNHCHVVVTATMYDAEAVRDQFKSWSTRRLNELERSRGEAGMVRDHWWTRKGSVRLLFNDQSLRTAVQYTLEAQDAGGSRGSE